MSIWHDITFRLQSQFGGALLHPNSMPGLPGNMYGIDELLHTSTFDIHPAQHGGFTQLPTDSLSSLSELSFLEMVHLPNTPSPTSDNYQNPDPATWLWGQNMSPGMGSLQVSPQRKLMKGRPFTTTPQHELQMLNTSEPSLANGVSSYGFGDLPLTVNLATISPPPVGVFDLSQEEDQKSSVSSSSSSCGLSLDLASDGPLSPVGSFSRSSPNAQQTFFTDTTSTTLSEPFRRHSVGPSSAPERTVGEKTKRDGGDASYEDDEQHHHSYADVTAEDSYLPATATTAGVAHTSKRRRAAAGAMMIPKATSAPARFIVPLPNIVESAPPQCDDDETSSICSGSTNSQTQNQSSSLAPFSTPSPAPPPARKAPRGGRRSRVPRTKCEFCPKTFSRTQDAQRHATASCPDNPLKAGVRCPECGEVLSRPDSAKRHWRGHASPRCEPPEWA